MKRLITCIIASVSVAMSVKADDVTVAKCEYWLDHDFDSRAELPVSPDGVFEHSFDMSDEAPGLHAIALRFCDSRGLWSSPVLRHFVKVREEAVVSSSLSEFIYWLDYDKEHAVKSSCADGIVEMSLDVATMSPGLHSMTYMMSENNGLYSPAVTRYFVIPHSAPKEGSVIAGYEYWFNHGKPVYVAVAPAQAVELNDVTIEAVNVRPVSIPDDYLFDAAALTVTCPQSDVFFGMQAVDDAGGRSGAVVSDTVKVDLTFTPEMTDLTAAAPVELLSPAGSDMAGMKIEASAGDRLIVDVAGSNAKVDFFGADGMKLQPSVENLTDSRQYVLNAAGDVTYLLMHSADNPLSTATVSLDVKTSGLDDSVTYGTVISAVAGGIAVSCGGNVSVAVYAVSGIQLAAHELAAGNTVLSVSPGCYVVTVSDGTTARVLVK